jgi:hypothetical protein
MLERPTQETDETSGARDPTHAAARSVSIVIARSIPAPRAVVATFSAEARTEGILEP